MRMARFRLRTLMVAVGLIALAIGGWRGVGMWHKADFCRGWAGSHRKTAAFYREEAARPGCPPGDVEGFLWIARKEDLTARKYAAVAERPWLPYPGVGGPFYTPEDWAELGKPPK